MNISKILSVFVSILAIVLVAGIVSAEVTVNTPQFVFVGSNATITLQNSAADLVSVGLSANSTQAGIAFTFVPQNLNISGNNGLATSTLRATASGLRFGSYDATITVRDNSNTVVATQGISVAKTFCNAGPVGNNLTISNLDVRSDGDEDEEWKPLDTIEVEVDVENIGDNDIDDVIVEIGLFDSDGSNVIGDMDFSNADEEEFEIGDLNDGDEDTVTFEFTIPADFDITSSDYRLAIKAYSDGSENRVCVDNDNDEFDSVFYHSINIDQEDDEGRFVIVDNIQLPSEAVCSETVSGSFGVFNIGEDDQDQVRITMTNRELGVDEQFEIRNDFDVGDDAQFDFSFVVPSTVKDGNYNIAFRTEYDYRSGSYRESSDDNFIGLLRIVGCGNGNTPTPTPVDDIMITADLDSDPMPGETLDVSVTFRNRGSESVSLDLDADGFQSWAELDDISDDSFTLASGASKTITFSFSVDEGASGAESFVVQASANGVVETQEVEVVFPEVETPGSGFSLSGNRTMLWIIGAINVVLIVLIIVVAIRLARK